MPAGGGAYVGDGSGAGDSTSTYPNRSVFQPGMGPQDFGQAYRPYNEGGRSITYLDRLAEQKQVEEVNSKTLANFHNCKLELSSDCSFIFFIL